MRVIEKYLKNKLDFFFQNKQKKLTSFIGRRMDMTTSVVL